MAITVGGCLWSFLVESALPYLRRGPAGLILVALSVLQVIAALVGIAAMLLGAARFLRAWLRMGWALGSMQKFLEASPPFTAIRQESGARARWCLALALIGRILLLPGLGLMGLGFGVLLLAFQFLEPDRWFRPDPVIVTLGLLSLLLGGTQILFRYAQRVRK